MAVIEKRAGSDGKASYRVKVRIKGFAPETATFERKTDAKDWATKIEADMKAGRHFGQSKRHTLKDLIGKYVDGPLQALKSKKSVETRLNWWIGRDGEKLLSELTPDVVAQARDALLATPKQRGQGKRTPADVNRTLAALSSACRYGILELGWLERNPVDRVSKGKEGRGRVRFLDEQERDAFLKACRESKSRHLYLAVVLSLTTGGRESEVMGLRWAQLDLVRRTALLGDTKNGDVRVLPLAGEALDLLKARSKVRALDDDRLFPPRAKSKAPYAELRESFRKALKTANIIDFRWHDLRHTAASYLAMAGVSPLEISKILGHRTMSMVSR
ncbi:tyrosine-type recombinase/integrase, partial [Pseudoduganella violaceinigra]|uniref:tyrosine-type recombinase/integrase n=1 Tax=Pseudoduganella violaceinigra TaxID=246602 RepID=UPI000555CF1E